MSSASMQAQTLQSTLDSMFLSVFSARAPGGVVLVSRAGQPLYYKAFGLANLESGAPMTTDHVFRLGSITKQFTAVSILQLVEKGKLSLSDSLSKFIPDYPNGGRITIEYLLGHTAGVKNYTALPAFTEQLKRQDLSPKQLIALFKDQPLDFEPGSNQLYSNSGYILLGYIIERVSGRTYEQFVQENIFKPLHMDHTSYDDTRQIISNRLAGYRGGNGNYVNAPYLSMTLPYAAGSLLSTAGDLLKWYTALSAGHIISNESLEKAFTSFVLPNGEETGYGYGWEIGNIQGSKSVKHTGVVNGFFTDVVYMPAEKILVAVLSNNEYNSNLDISASKAAAAALGRPYRFDKIALSDKERHSYQSGYLNADEGERFIADQDGELYHYTRGGNKVLLIPYQKDAFNMERTLNTILFSRDSKGNIEGYQIKGVGNTRIWKKSKVPFAVPQKIKLPQKVLEAYIGKYAFGKMVFEVFLQDGQLYGRMGQDQKVLFPFGKNKFYAKDLDAVLIFNSDKKGIVISVTKVQNSEMVGFRM
ncbi:serine hydrolase [Pedobacter duraquae]|nr:serine hydrolase [Pedobacter duraquae]